METSIGRTPDALRSDHSVHPLPLVIEEINRDWLTRALRARAPDVTVRNFEIVDVNRGTCTKIRLRLELDDAGQRAAIPKSVILKGGFEPHSRAMAQMHKAEVDSYRDIMPALKLHTPRCYFADYDPEREQGIVIMEDLVARGVTFCHPLVPQSFEQVARRLTALAQFHARTWNSPEILPGGRWHSLRDGMPTTLAYMAPYLEPATWGRFVASSRGAASSVRFHDPAWMKGALDALAKLAEGLPQTVIDGDTHLGNLYVEQDGTPGFFDFQPMRAPAAMELAYHITCALDTADRPRWDRALVQHYLDELARNGVDPPGFDRMMHDFGAFLAFGYGIFLVNESFFQPEAINTAYTARFSAAMIDHKTIELLRAIG